MPEVSEIERIAKAILDLRPCPVVEYRIRRDVLLEDPAGEAMEALRRRVNASAGVVELEREQKADGSWGRFHSQDTKVRARFVTSERAIERALALGLDRRDPVLSRAVRFMERVLRGEADWSDRVEKAEAWGEGKRVITAGTLALIDPDNEELRSVWELWAAVAEAALAGGEHSLERENRAFRQVTGVAFKSGYLHSVYALNLLGSRGRDLPAGLSRAILAWIWNSGRGIGYVEADLRNPSPTRLEPWIRSLEVLSAFPGWRDRARDAVAWLWDQRQDTGLWDFGKGMRTGFWFPLSDRWVRRGNRAIDQSTRILMLLRKHAG